LFCRSFFWALLQANSCVLQLRGFCFPGSALTHYRVPPKLSSRSLWKKQPSLLVTRESGAEKDEKFMSYLNSVTIIGFVGANPKQRQPRNNNDWNLAVPSVAT
jgi:hypothetical protein